MLVKGKKIPIMFEGSRAYVGARVVAAVGEECEKQDAEMEGADFTRARRKRGKRRGVEDKPPPRQQGR
eukprot:3707538-Prorocentrum_lima.AAC.1